MNNLHALARIFFATVAVNLFMLVIIVLTHAGPFSMLTDPFSWLGKAVTSGGLANTGALLLFSATVLFNACRWRQVLSLLSQYRAGKRPGVRTLGRAVLAGFVLMAFPCDVFVTTHSVGAGLVVGGLWALTTAMLNRMRNQLGPFAHVSLQLILHLSAVFCGVNFVLDTTWKGFSQRPLLVAIIAGTGICLKALTRGRMGRDPAYCRLNGCREDAVVDNTGT